jgi:hypothetical protein
MRLLRLRHGALRSLMQMSAVAIGCGIAADAQAQMTAFRMDDLDLRDPHVFINFITCLDVTDTPILGFSINGQLQTSIQNDAASPQDGLLDLSNVFLFDPLDQGVASNTFATGTSDCSAPLAGTQCNGFTASTLSGTAGLLSSGSCLVPLAGATHGYSPAIISATAPCFSSPSGTIIIDLSGVPVPLQDAQIAATFDGAPVTGTINGLMKGFLLESDADATIVPMTFPLVGGQPLSQLLPGGDPPGANNANCAAHSDVDIHNGQRGWWFYLNFTAPVTPLNNDPFAAGFGDGFEG